MENASGDAGLVEKIDSEVRKAIEGAKIFSEWIPSLFTGQGIELPGKVRQVTQNTLRSADATPSATPRELLSARQGPNDGMCAEPDNRRINRPNDASSSSSPRGALEEGGSRLFSTLFGAVGRGIAQEGTAASGEGGEGEANSPPKTNPIDADANVGTVLAAKVASMVNRGCRCVSHRRLAPVFRTLSWFLRIAAQACPLPPAHVSSCHFSDINSRSCIHAY